MSEQRNRASDSGQQLYNKQQKKVQDMYRAIDDMYIAGKEKAAYKPDVQDPATQSNSARA